MSIRDGSQEVADIMASEELTTMVDRGWAVLPLARQALSTLKDDPTVSASAGDLGRRLFRLAAGFKSCGEPIPGRLVLGLAEAFTELSHQNLTHSEQTFDVLQTAISELGDLLVELDATGQITIPEPIDTMALLEATVAHQRTTQPAMIDIQCAVLGVRPDPLTDLHRCGDALFSASESLLNRIQRDDASPYWAPVSRIHHLASTLRERLGDYTPRMLAANLLATEPTASLNLDADEPVNNEDTIRDADLIEDRTHLALVEVATEREMADSQPAWLPTGHSPKVLVIDESPFFRMLLGTAIASAGHAALTLASLDESEAPLNESQASDIVIWGGIDSSALTDCLTDWILRRDDSRRPMLIGLVNGSEQSGETPTEFDHLVPRAHLPELLRIIRDKLGDATQAMKKTA